MIWFRNISLPRLFLFILSNYSPFMYVVVPYDSELAVPLSLLDHYFKLKLMCNVYL